jgi:regulator of PEP synthase PpsR (kinase-PPPase family)
MINDTEETSYTDIETVKAEVAEARKLFSRHGWPVLDVSRRSIEETAAAVMQMITERREKAALA